MGSNERVWLSRCFDYETAAEAASRFVSDVFGVEQKIRLRRDGEHFEFDGSYWRYAIVKKDGHWSVFRTQQKSKAGEARSKSRWGRWPG